MRTDSCRTCGNDMKELQRCVVCDGIVRLVCKGCKKQSDERVHLDCGMTGKTVLLT